MKRIRKIALIISLCFMMAEVFGAGFSYASDAAADQTSVSASTDESSEESDDSMFSSRDLEQTADLSEAVTVVLSDGKDVEITEAGVYILSGSVFNSTIRINTDAENDKVQLVLNGVSIINDNAPAVYVISAKKVFITTVEGTENNFTVSGGIEPEGDTNLDAAVFSKDDLVFNGLGTLTISSTDNGIVGKDKVKVTGGTYVIDADDDGFEVNDSVMICGGTFEITAQKDGFHVVNDDDTSKGSIYISGGSFNIDAMRQGIQATTTFICDGGDMYIDATEGIEATYIQINDGTIEIHGYDDGINATSASSYYDVLVEINGGSLTINMESGDTDGIDANGSIVINGGYVDVTGQSTFDYDTSGVINGGTVIVNGEQVDTLPQSQMGGGGGGGHGGHGGF